MGAKLPKEVSRECEAEAWALRQRFWSQQRIAEKLGISQMTVCRMLARVERRALAKMDARIGRTKVRQTAQLETIAAEAFEAWEHSKTPMTVEKVTTGGDGDDDTMSIETRSHQCNAALLAQARGALSDIRGIWGMDAPSKTDVTTDGESLKGYVGFDPADV